jgi:hypothetical protein
MSPASSSPAQMQEILRRHVPQIYEISEVAKGYDAESCYQAEAEVLRESTLQSLRRAIVVNIEGVVYTGEYECSSADGNLPGEWQPGDPIAVRVEGDKMYLRRPNGREIETTIVKRIG